MGLNVEKDVTGVISDEIGGGNGLEPMIVATAMGKVVLDADLMGRAYPNVCGHYTCCVAYTHYTYIHSFIRRKS